MKAIKLFCLFLLVFSSFSARGSNDSILIKVANIQLSAFQDSLTEKEKVALFLGSVYYASNPIFELNKYAGFDAFLLKLGENVNLNELFAASSQTIALIRSVGQNMIQSGINSYVPQDQNWAYGRALEMGADMDQARKISSEVNNGSVDLFAYGQELVWLSQVLPEYVKGNKVPFLTTGTITRNTIREWAPMMISLGGEAILEYLKPYGPYLAYQCAIFIYDYMGK